MATLGRQGLHANRPALISILRNAGYELSRECERKLLDPTTIYSEDFFGLLGASKITAIDANSYEGAEIVHDMNRPIPECLVSSFDLLLDGGTLEHVFDFPTAIRNVMQMVATNGRFISCTVANNFSGHGFYQFSPELFYRVLCRESGYLVETCIIWEEIHGSRFYQVPDPDTVGSRIELTSQSGTYLFLQAKRLGNVSLDHIAQQSDYMRHWSSVSGDSSSGISRPKPMEIRTQEDFDSAFGCILRSGSPQDKHVPAVAYAGSRVSAAAARSEFAWRPHAARKPARQILKPKRSTRGTTHCPNSASAHIH